jgi:ribonuclease I
MQIIDAVAMSCDFNTRLTTLLICIHNDMRYNASKEFLNEFAYALMYEPCDIHL